MDKLLDILLCGTVTIIEVIIIFIITMLIQLIMYRIFGINLFKLIIKYLNKLDEYLNKIFQKGNFKMKLKKYNKIRKHNYKIKKEVIVGQNK